MNFRRHLRQRCVYWAPTGVDEQGQHTYAQAVEMACRWTEAQEIIQRDGKAILSKAKVHPEKPVELDGVLWKGTLYELAQLYPDESYWTTPFLVNGCFAIQNTRSVPDLRAKNYWHTARI